MAFEFYNFTSEEINSRIKKYGINYKIGNIININNFILGKYDETGIHFNVDDNLYSINEMNDIGIGSYNKIKLGKINIKGEEKTVAIRLSTKYLPKRELLYSMIENLKHILLFELLSIKEEANKILPIPYFLFYTKIIYKGIEYYRPIFIMEYYQFTLYDIIKKIKNNIEKKENLVNLKNIYYGMHLGLEKIKNNGILFRHGDLKENNIMLNNDGKTVMIDFGFSSIKFMVDDKKILLNGTHPLVKLYNLPKINIFHDMFFLRYNITKYRVKIFGHETFTVFNRRFYKNFIKFLKTFDSDIFRFLYEIKIDDKLLKYYVEKIKKKNTKG